MNIELKHYKNQYHKTLIVLNKSEQLMLSCLKNVMGAPEGPDIFNQINDFTGNCRLSVSENLNPNLNQTKKLLLETIDFLNYLKSRSSKQKLPKIESMINEVIQYNQSL